MAPPGAGLKALDAKRYILAALTATIVVAVVVTVSFVVLSPARIHFSVTHVGSQQGSGDDGAKHILILAANNTSRRAAVTYQSMFVDVSNGTWPRTAGNITTRLPLRQPMGNVTTIVVRVPGAAAILGNMTGNLTVFVTAVAWFKVGIARTRLYDIKVTCEPVSFFPHASKSASYPAVICA